MEEKTELEQCVLLNDSILVELKEGDSRTKSGIILHESSKRTKGEIVKTGPGVYTQNGEQLPMQVKTGDIVLLKNDKDSYKDIKLDGGNYKFANEREVTVVLKR